MESRRAFKVLAQDVGNAWQLTTAQSATLVLTMQSPTNPNSFWTVTYAYDGVTQRLTRADSSTGITTVILTNLTTAPAFKYYNRSGAEASAFIKQVQLSYVSAVGSAANATRSSNTVVSARWMLRNKSATGQ
jgi:hypothetical protein